MNVINADFRRHSVELLNRYKAIHPSELGHVIEFGFLPGDISLVNTKPCNVVGSALTVRITPTDSVLVYKAISMAKPGDVLVVDMQGEKRHACWGEITTLFAKKQQLAGAVIDGPVTDSRRIDELGVPVFSRGRSNLTTKLIGFRGDINVPVSIGGVSVSPGDIVLGNEDGVLVVPFDYADKLITYAEKAEEDDEERKDESRSIMEIMQIEKYVSRLELLEGQPGGR
jgi:regulator of RNase E activity RraA